MGTIFKYELRKVFLKKSYIIALLIMLLIMIMNEATPIILGNYKPKKDLEMSLSGTVINDEYLSNLQPTDEHNTTNPLEYFVKASSGQTDITGFTEESLYNTRKEINNSLMRKDGISEKAIAVWNKWDEKNVAPFTYFYSGTYTSIFEISGYMNFMLLIVTGIGLSGIFAEEKSSNMDQLIFCSRNGKVKLFGIKAAVGGILGLVTVFVMVAVELITCVTLYGTQGANMMIQIVIPQCLLHLNMGQAVFIMFITFIFEEMAFVIIILFASQLTMNRAITISTMFVIMFMGMLNIPENLGVIYILWNAIPGATVGSWLFDNHHLISIFGLNIVNLIYTPVIWVIAGTGLIFLTKMFYTKYQVKSR